MKNQLCDNPFISIMKTDEPTAAAVIHGSAAYPSLSGHGYFYDVPFGGVIINVEIWGLPDIQCSPAATYNNSQDSRKNNFSEKLLLSWFYGMGVHEHEKSNFSVKLFFLESGGFL